MKFTALRQYIMGKDLSSPHILGDCELVIDGDSFFKDTYRNSGCQFALGPECDRYANFISKTLSLFVQNDVKFYVIFSGAAKQDTGKRKEIHQRIIDNINDMSIDMVGYFQPLLVDDVQKQVLERINKKYFVCEYDSIEAIVGVARKLKCPVLTNNVEYSCFGVSCITPDSVEHDKGVTKIKCTIYEHDKVKTAIGVYSKMPILLALLTESGEYLENLAEIIKVRCSDDVRPVIQWVKRQKEVTAVSIVSRSIDDEDQNRVFKEVYEKIQTIYLYPLCNLVVKYFQRDKTHKLFKGDKKWFAKGVCDSRIAVPYINLKNKGLICGSSIMNDSKRPDALLAAFDIIVYSHCLLKNSQDSMITFIGREGKKSSVKEIVNHWDKEISNRVIFTKHRDDKVSKLLPTESEAFEQFLEEVLPGYDYKKLLEPVPKECWMLIITLVYYVINKNKDFIKGAYCVLLSYLMLGPVSRVVDNLKKNGQSLTISNTEKDAIYNSLQFLFDKVKSSSLRNYTTVVHDTSEFQHCLQHMNYLNKLCGEKIPCTVYQDTYNATFIYNAHLLIDDNKDGLMHYLETRFIGSMCLKTYKSLVTCFENSLKSIKNNKMSNPIRVTLK